MNEIPRLSQQMLLYTPSTQVTVPVPKVEDRTPDESGQERRRQYERRHHRNQKVIIERRVSSDRRAPRLNVKA
ncbi:MAG: hypothetical protein JJU48_09350 [Methylophaga sp.]|nr:hypothetical protein [Methylophaga sp.]